jgi:hypothetical protein
VAKGSDRYPSTPREPQVGVTVFLTSGRSTRGRRLHSAKLTYPEPPIASVASGSRVRVQRYAAVGDNQSLILAHKRSVAISKFSL